MQSYHCVGSRRLRRGQGRFVAFVSVLTLVVAAGIGSPTTRASVELVGGGIDVPPGSSGTPAVVNGVPASPPPIYGEPTPSADTLSDSVGATPGVFRVDEGGGASYSIPIYVPSGTAGFAPQLSIDYHHRGSHGPLGPGWAISGLSAISRCKKAPEYGDGAGPFAPLNFDSDTTNDAYCLDGVRLIDQNLIAGSCPSDPAGGTSHAFGSETDPSLRVCAYGKTGVTGYAYWAVQPKDGSTHRYGLVGNSALLRNDGAGTADTTQIFTWALDRVADATGNVIDFIYQQPGTASGELEIQAVNYTGKVALANVLSATAGYTRVPYAKVSFTYGAMPASGQRVDYLAGMKLALTQQLTTVTVQGPFNSGAGADTLTTVRTYHLAYATPTASQLPLLTSIKECAPGGSGEVCYPSTTFAWNNAAASSQGFTAAPVSTSYGSALNFAVDYKIADINGDGRQDLVWLKDGSCDSTGSGATRFQMMVSMRTDAGFAAPVGTGAYVTRPPIPPATGLPACGQDFGAYHFENLWSVYDFNADGHDDVIASTGSAWVIYPAVLSSGNWTLDGAHPTSTGIAAFPTDDGRLADFDGDGLPDLLHADANSNAAVRFLKKGSGATPYVFAASDTLVDIEFPPNVAGYTFVGVGINSTHAGNPPAADIDGDGATDLLLKATYENSDNPPDSGCDLKSRRLVSSTGATFVSSLGSDGPDAVTAPCRRFWYVYRNAGLQPSGHLRFAVDTAINSAAGTVSLNGRDVQLVDVNGDGLADAVYQTLNGTSNQTFMIRLNTGKADPASTAARFAPEQSTGLILDASLVSHVQLLDINGDHRLDLFYPQTAGALKARLWGTGGFGAEVAVGNATSDAQPSNTLTFLIDVTGDGMPDLVRYASSAITVATNQSQLGGNDLLTKITNGLGAIDQIGYVPLTYSSVYTRYFDGPSQAWARGAPVFDVFGPLWVVRSASQSAPTSASTTAQSIMLYRYGGARMQGGGRGFLGFKTVQTENLQPAQDTANLLVTTTEYRQDFPFTGRPYHTVVELAPSALADTCTNPALGCFLPPAAPPAAIGINGQKLSDALNYYVSVPGWSAAALQPVNPYMYDSDEQKFDVSSSGTFSHDVHSSFTQDAFGNATQASVISAHGAPLVTDETKNTTSIYGCLASPPTIANCGSGSLDTQAKRLGRLSISTVTSSRAGAASITRRASFEYDATTRLLVSEIQGPYDDLEADANVRKHLGLRTDYLLDGDGNRVQQVVCSTSDFTNRSSCLNLSGFQQQQWSSSPTKIQRYSKRQYETKGRFLLAGIAPFYSASASNHTNENYAEITGFDVGGAQIQSSMAPLMVGSPSSVTLVVRRSPFGDPLNSYSSAGLLTNYTYGVFGRAYFSASGTGAFSRTTYRWCQDATSPDVPAAGRVNCPIGAAFRVAADSTVTTGQTGGAAGTVAAGVNVAPTAYSYFDVLGREVLKTTRIYQQSTTSNDRWSSTATTYDDTGRVKTTTVPYFSADPTVVQGATNRAGTPLHGAPALSQIDYDAVSRAKKVTHPETPVNGTSQTTMAYAELETDLTNPRNYVTKQNKNARDEVTDVTDANGLKVSYSRDAVGSINGVVRKPNDGDSAGVTITTSMRYDRLGRKTSMTDPDKGSWIYDYNALGELILQTDAKGQSRTLAYDALGRAILRTETRLSGGSQVSEPASAWEYDTAVRTGNLIPGSAGTVLLGLPHTESNGIGGFSRSVNYDDIGRGMNVGATLDGTTYTERQTYDAVGRGFQHFDPNLDANASNGEMTEYSADGYPIRTREAAGQTTGSDGQLYNEVQAMSARGQVAQEQFHQSSALVTTRTYDDNTGRMMTLNTGSGALQKWDYTYDRHTDLMSRWNHATGYNLREDFAYDTLDRLQTVTLTVNGTVIGSPLTVGYDQLGNLKSKSAGTTQTWTYGGMVSGCSQSMGPHAVTGMGGAKYCYDANGNQTLATYAGGSTRTITYTGYDLAESITTTGTPSASTISFKYAPDRSLWKRVDGVSGGGGTDRIFCNGFDATPCAPLPGGGGGGGSGTAGTTYFVGNVEIRLSGTVTTTKRNIGGYLIITTTGTSSPQYAYLFRDALGSLDVVTNQAGTVQQRQSFDAWGQRRDATPTGSWGLLPSAIAASFDTGTTYQGYTGHQQLDPVGLVHMKGRLYDPVLGRFIQADPMTDADATQGLNRYSYVLNNPLSLTDPSGYLSFRQWVGLIIIVVASVISQQYWAIGAYWSSFAVAVAGGFLSAYVSTGSLKAGLWGAFAAAVFWGIGAGFNQAWAHDTGLSCSAEMTQGAQWAKVAAHAAAGGVLSEMQGGNFGSGFLAAGATEAASPAIEGLPEAGQVIASAVVGGTVSQATGGTFANGAETALFQSLFNNFVHSAVKAIQNGALAANKPVVGISSANEPNGYRNLRDALIAQDMTNEQAYQATSGSEELWGYIGARTINGEIRYFFSDMILIHAPFTGDIVARMPSDMTIADLNHTHAPDPKLNEEHFSNPDSTQSARIPLLLRSPAGDIRILNNQNNTNARIRAGESLCGAAPCLPPWGSH
ncbi:MAG: RHS repeat-associated core domain-containing protein [Dokdonella sp.]